MSLKICREVRREIEEAGPDERLSTEASAHVRVCSSCREFDSEQAALRRLIGSVETVAAPADFEFRLRARLAAAEKSSWRRLLRFEAAPGMPAIALAASFALLVTAAVIFKQIQSNRTTARPTSQTIEEIAAGQDDSQVFPLKVETDGQQASDASGQGVKDAQKLNHEEPGSAVESKPRSPLEKTAKTSFERGVSSPESNRPRTQSVDFGASVAPVIPLVVVQGPATNQPVRVSLDDGLGKTRTVSLQPVTFGSQNLIEQSTASRTSFSDPRGIW
jgi:hypothetical protein